MNDQRLQHAREYIEHYRERRQSNKVLHGHPSPMFWLDRDVKIAEVMRARQRANAVMAIRAGRPVDFCAGFLAGGIARPSDSLHFV